MDARKYKIAHFISLYLSGLLSEQEHRELMTWVEENEANKSFFCKICAENDAYQKMSEHKTIDWQTSWKQFERHHTARKRSVWRRVARYAAIFLFPLTLATAIWLLNTPEQATLVADMPAIHSGAVLTLGSGKQIILADRYLDSLNCLGQNITVDNQNKTLQYTNQTGNVEYNTLNTPRGGEYKVRLSDGTFVHLNAATKLKYPITFDAHKREVYLSGEAWFEVTKDTLRPFYVVAEDVRVRVYGTRFNVNTHIDGVVQTVLVEGSVGLSQAKSGQEIMLKPAQLGCYHREDEQIIVENVDVLKYTGWKDGLLVFSDETLLSILERLSVWYDVEVFYTSESVKTLRFSGYLERYNNIGVLLKAIEETVSVHFKIKDHTIIVSQ